MNDLISNGDPIGSHSIIVVVGFLLLYRQLLSKFSQNSQAEANAQIADRDY